jgi:hypothetical protein
MHDRTRRMLCRAGFLALCVLPTAAVFAWSSSRTSRAHVSACAAERSRELGLRVALAGVSYPRPGATLYEGIELADSETGAPLVQMRSLEADRGNNLTALFASQPELDALQLAKLWEIVERRIHTPTDPQSAINLTASAATLHWSGGSQTLTEVLGQLDATSGNGGERVAAVRFRLAGVDSAEPIRLRYSRKLADSRTTGGVEQAAASRVERFGTSRVELPAVSNVELHTGGAAVPCSLLTVPLGIANRLGERARFRGSVWATETADGWEGELTGQFTDVDLQTAITEQFPHHLVGTAEITIQKARFRRGRLEEASGTIAAGPGMVSQSLLTAAAENLHLRSAVATESGASIVPYDRLALSFEIDPAGLTLRGQCEGSVGTVLRRGETVLLAESGGSSGPVVALLRMLVPQSEVQVPATREADWLMRRLPVPQVMPPATQPPQGRVRLKPQGPG